MMRTLSTLFALRLSVILTWQTNALMNYQRLSPNACRRNNRSSCLSMRLNPTSFEGSDMTITEYPMPGLRRPNADIKDFDDNLRKTAKEMMSVMYQAKGVGLAAPQVNLGLRLFVYNPSGDPKEKKFERVVCNPTIKEYSKETDVEEEGCLSSLSDDCFGCVCRACAIMVEYENELGQKTMRRLKGWEARVFQHEYDHIQGILHFDRFSPSDKEKNQSMLDKLVQDYDRSDAILEPDPLIFKTIEPPPLMAGRMPPMTPEVETPAKKSKTKGKITGFGSGGFGGGGKKSKKKK